MALTETRSLPTENKPFEDRFKTFTKSKKPKQRPAWKDVSLPEDETVESIPKSESDPHLPTIPDFGQTFVHEPKRGETFFVETGGDENLNVNESVLTKETEGKRLDKDEEISARQVVNDLHLESSFKGDGDVVVNNVIDSANPEAAAAAPQINFSFDLDLDNLDLSLSPDRPTPASNEIVNARRVSSDTYVKSSPSLANLTDLASPVTTSGEAAIRRLDVVVENDALELSGISPIASQETTVVTVANADNEVTCNNDECVDEASLLIANQLRLSRGDQDEVEQPPSHSAEAVFQGRILCNDESVLMTGLGQHHIQNSFLMCTNIR